MQTQFSDKMHLVLKGAFDTMVHAHGTLKVDDQTVECSFTAHFSADYGNKRPGPDSGLLAAALVAAGRVGVDAVRGARGRWLPLWWGRSTAQRGCRSSEPPARAPSARYGRRAVFARRRSLFPRATHQGGTER
jgi:hypothetical protein